MLEQLQLLSISNIFNFEPLTQFEIINIGVINLSQLLYQFQIWIFSIFFSIFTCADFDFYKKMYILELLWHLGWANVLFNNLSFEFPYSTIDLLNYFNNLHYYKPLYKDFDTIFNHHVVLLHDNWPTDSFFKVLTNNNQTGDNLYNIIGIRAAGYKDVTLKLVLDKNYEKSLTVYYEQLNSLYLNTLFDKYFKYNEFTRHIQSIALDNKYYFLGIKPIFFNNIFLCCFIILFSLLICLLLFTTKNLYILPTSNQTIIWKFFQFIWNILDTQVGKKAQRFFPYVFTIFIIILFANLLGMTLFAFTITSHIMVTFTLGVSSFIGLTILGFFLQKMSFLNLFLPKGIPSILIPILMVVELISYLSRALSLSIRLFANLMSGHTLLHILAFFASKLCKFNLLLGLASAILIISIIFLELCIAMLQAYVFTILISIYLNDSFNASH